MWQMWALCSDTPLATIRPGALMLKVKDGTILTVHIIDFNKEGRVKITLVKESGLLLTATCPQFNAQFSHTQLREKWVCVRLKFGGQMTKFVRFCTIFCPKLIQNIYDMSSI